MSPLVDVQEAEGERGLYAREDMPAGTIILTEQPHVFSTADDDLDGLICAHVLGRGLLDREHGLRAAPGTARVPDGSEYTKAAAWLANVDGVSEDDAKRAFAAGVNNGFVTLLEGTGDVAMNLLFEKTALLNHACWPNCALQRGTKSGRACVYTISAVRKGAQLFICYSEDVATMPPKERREMLMGSFGLSDAAASAAAKLPQKVDALLTEWDNGDEPASRRAHAQCWKVTRNPNTNVFSGFNPKQHESNADARRVLDGAMAVLVEECAPTHWMVVQTRGLLCTVLEGLADDTPTSAKAFRESTLARAYTTLVEHAAALVQLHPPHTDPLIQLAGRLDAFEVKLGKQGGEAGKKALAKAKKAYGKALDALKKQREVVDGWLSPK